MKTTGAITLIMLIALVITGIMIAGEMNSLRYALSGSLTVKPFLPLGFGMIMSVVVAATKKDDKEH